MKRISSLLFLLFIGYLNSSAQVGLDALIKIIDWNKTESQIISDHPILLEKRTHYYNKNDGSTVDYVFKNIAVGEYLGNADLEVDSITRKPVSISLSLGDNFKGMTDKKIIIERLEKALFPILGSPDIIKNGEDYLKDYSRQWYKDGYKVDTDVSIYGSFILCQITITELKSGNDFRNSKWGDSKECVMSKEQNKTVLFDNDLIYCFKDNIAGMNCEVAFIFTDNKLSMAKYLFREEHSNKNDYIKDYNSLVELMESKYGKPSYNEPHWKNSLYKQDSENYGLATSIGHLSYSSGWSDNKTKITVALHGENYKITLLVQYVSNQYDSLREKKNKERLSEGL